ncbi:MAG: DNA repair protein RecN [Termitinemataceae bacterium]|nr:MAG: DNA repair protein RecN [Termitinemataceae bacterium]
MLEELSVRNYALIENLTLSFERGLTILTGETGAGKSIIVGSLSFLLGAKAEAATIRGGAEEAAVSAVLAVNEGNVDARTWLAGHDIALEDERVIVRRTIKTTGRSSVYIQNVPVSRADLAEFMAFLFDIHGQHAHESLLRPDTHRRYLDRFAGLEAEAAAFNKIFVELSEKRKKFENSLADERDRDARIEILTFSVDEIEKAAIKTGEIRDLEAESSRLVSFEKLSSYVESACSDIFGDIGSAGRQNADAVSLLRRAKASIESAGGIDSSLAALQQRIADIFYEVEDVSSELHSYCESLSFEPARLEQVEERLALLHKLKKKYGARAEGLLGEKPPEEAILAYKAQAEAEIEALQSSEHDREKLKLDISALEKQIAAAATALTAKRRLASAQLSQRISAILAKLGMKNAIFSVSLELKESMQAGNLRCGPFGADDVEFLISANTGEEPRELARIASGGELSRVMLAIKTALLDDEADVRNSAETLIFDEIDAGIGGEVALAVGEYLWKIGAKKQIFCITHLASIAVRADNHLKVEKTSDGKRTMTGVSHLKTDERRMEIARMLSGDKGETALAHAGDLLAKYGGRE